MYITKLANTTILYKDGQDKFLLKIISLFMFMILGSMSPFSLAEEETKGDAVNITKKVLFVDVVHHGEKIRIQRNQDTKNTLKNSFAKTSRKCPPFCIQPIKMMEDEGISTVGELELLKFLQEKVSSEKGFLIDARLANWYGKGTIPSAINIPFTIFTAGLEDTNTAEILKLLNAQEKQGKWDFKNSKELLLFCNGPWCGQSAAAIRGLLKMGYPAKKLFWYRGGMQAWQSFGLTTVMP